ncbi:MAG: HD domain-containing protein [Patescibacteria group bacterium]
MIDRNTAFNWLKQRIQNKNLIKHMVATEAIMRALANKLGHDADKWGLVGLVHDLDFEETKDRPEQHGLVTEKFLKERGIEDQDIVQAIKSHNAEGTGVPRAKELDYALTAAEQITGLIVGCALVMPEKKLASVNKDTVLKKYKQKAFTANVDRELIMLCQKIGFTLEDFVELSLKSMQLVAGELSL